MAGRHGPSCCLCILLSTDTIQLVDLTCPNSFSLSLHFSFLLFCIITFNATRKIYRWNEFNSFFSRKMIFTRRKRSLQTLFSSLNCLSFIFSILATKSISKLYTRGNKFFDTRIPQSKENFRETIDRFRIRRE